MKYFLCLLALALLITPVLAQVGSTADAKKQGAPGTSSADDPRLGKSPMADVIAAMTTREKALLLVGMGFRANIPGIPPMAPEDARVPEKVPGAAGRTHAIPRLGIPSITLSDGPAGVRIDPVRDDDTTRTYHATAFPVATLLASSWDTALVRNVGVVFGREAREYGVDIILAPGMNLHRNPLGGRNFEYYSEDPLVSGQMAAAFIDGFESEGVGTAPKHFAANNQEFNRMKLNTVVNERALRELYLKGFEIAVKDAEPWTVMSAYNLINDVHSSQSPELLTTVLRDEWGFEGFVMTDWFGGDDPVAQVAAGNDVIMPGFPALTAAIVAASEHGLLSQRQLDLSVERVLRVVMESPTFRAIEYSGKPDLAAGAAVARRAAAESMVLLKNDDGALPIATSHNVALFGNTSYDLIIGGTGSGDVNEAYSVSLDAGLKHAGFTIDSELEKSYTAYIVDAKAKRPPPPMPFFPPPPIAEMVLDAQTIKRAAQDADVAIFTLGRRSGEFEDRPAEEFGLSDVERSLVGDISKAFHAVGKNVVVVMNVGGVTEVASWRDAADAILLAWQPGQEGGNAIADVLSGRVNPSGKLASTFPVAYSDVSSAPHFPGKVLPGDHEPPPIALMGVPSEVVYEEGIYVGYRYHTTFDIKPAYEFGFGLSYTDFEFAGLMLGSDQLEDSITAELTVTNTGKVAGREVVQLYVSAPAGGLDKPERELRAFAKTDLLQPGHSQTLAFTLKPEDVASFDTERSAWVAAAGTYAVLVGASSLDIRQHAKFELPAEQVVSEVHRVLAPQVQIDERKAR